MGCPCDTHQTICGYYIFIKAFLIFLYYNLRVLRSLRPSLYPAWEAALAPNLLERNLLERNLLKRNLPEVWFAGEGRQSAGNANAPRWVHGLPGMRMHHVGYMVCRECE